MDQKKESFINGYLKISKILYYITKVTYFFFIVMTVIFALIVTSTFFTEIGEKTLSSLKQIGFVNNSFFSINYKHIFAFMMSQVLCFSALTTFFIKQINKILRTVMEKKPFVYQNAISIKNMGWLLIVQSLIDYTYNSIVELFLLKQSVSVPLITSGTPLLLFGICLLILSGVFRYGCFLQEEYDSML